MPRGFPPDGAGPSVVLLQLVERLPHPLLFQALTHASWVEERTESYERLEFLGDSVLGLAVASHLYERFPEKDEGPLAKLKAFVVSRESCGRVAKCAGLDDLLLRAAPGPVEQRLELAENETVLGNVLEALIGGIYLAFGYEEARAAVIEAFRPQVEFGLAHDLDYKTALQERLAARGLRAEYRLLSEEGAPHERRFTSVVVVQGAGLGEGSGRSIKSSEREAARRALESMDGAEEEGGGR